MLEKTLLVFYGEDLLPYKDKELTTRYPIIGSAFVGASDTTKIKFYVDKIGNENTEWLAVASLPNGKEGNRILTQQEDELGRYVELSLSHWFLQVKGDLFINLRGYQGGITYTYDDEEDIYVISGTPTCQATGSIKIAVNYAPKGETPNLDDEFDTYQDILSLMGDKLNIRDGITVVSNINNVSYLNYPQGSYIFDKQSKILYVAGQSSFEELYKTYSQTEIDTELSLKVDKTTIPNTLYGVDSSGNQTNVSFVSSIAGGGAVKRSDDGNIFVPSNPTNNQHATSKKYVDDTSATTKEYVDEKIQTVIEIAEGKTNTFVISYNDTIALAKSNISGDIYNSSRFYVYNNTTKQLDDKTTELLNGDYDSYDNGISLINARFNSQADYIYGQTGPNYLLCRGGFGQGARDDYRPYVYIFVPLMNALKIGDEVFVVETDVPDRWAVGNGPTPGFSILETKKIELTNYYTKGEIDTELANYYTQAQVDTSLSTKLDKNSTMNSVYGVNGSAEQIMIPLNNGVLYNAIPQRTATGQLKVPTTPSENNDATSKSYVDGFAKSLVVSIDSSTYVITFTLKDKNNTTLSTQTIDLPLESVVVNGSYNDTTKSLILTLQSGSTISIPVSDLVEGLVNETDLTATLLEYAKVDGYYPTLHSGLSDDLYYKDGQGSTQTKPFIFQATGTDSNTSTVQIGNFLSLKSLRGNSVVFNQLVQNGNFEDISNWSVSGGNLVVREDNIGTLTITSPSSSNRFYQDITPTPNHKYLIKFDIRSSVRSVGNLRFGNDYTGTSTYSFDIGTTKTTQTLLLTPIQTTYAFSIYVNKNNLYLSSGDKVYLSNVNIFDLTLMFGAGNEPTSALEFNRLFPEPYYEYNTGTLLSCKSNGLKVVGYNQYDNSNPNDYIKVVAGQKYTLEGTYTSVALYDGDQHLLTDAFVSGSALPNNCHYLKITGGSANTCLHLTWDGSRTGYEEYESNTYPLPNIELRSNPATGTYDELKPDGTLIKRVDVRAYQSGDESDSSLTTDKTNTIYDLATPTETQDDDYAFTEIIPIDDFGTQEFLYDNDIIPQGNESYYPPNYSALVDQLYRHTDGDAEKLALKREIKDVVADTESAFTSRIETIGFFKDNAQSQPVCYIKARVSGYLDLSTLRDVFNNVSIQYQIAGTPGLVNSLMRQFATPVYFIDYVDYPGVGMISASDQTTFIAGNVNFLTYIQGKLNDYPDLNGLWLLPDKETDIVPD